MCSLSPAFSANAYMIATHRSQPQQSTQDAEHISTGRPTLRTVIQHTVEADFESGAGRFANALQCSVRSTNNQTCT